MKKDAFIFIQHIMDSIEKIESFTKSVSRREFFDSVMLQDAVIRRLEIIGEAVKNVPVGFRKKYPSIPWSAMARTRDKLIHGYFGVDIGLTWDIVKNDLPGLKREIKKTVLQTWMQSDE